MSDLPNAWFGKLKSRWPVVPIRGVAKLGTGHTPSRSVPEYWENCTIPWVTVEDIRREGEWAMTPLLETEQHISELGLANSAAVLHPAGTVMLSRTASIGLSCIVGRPMATTQAFVTWTPNNEVLDGEYLLAALKAMSQQFEYLAYGATHLTIYFPDISVLRIPLPPRDVQAAIVTFIKRETAKIDALIAEQQRLIELLQEKRQAVISHAVTKGLNPDAPMKDSGIEWLGEVPEHWGVARLDRVSDFVNGKAHEPFVHDDGRFICVTSRFVSTDGEALKMCSENLTPAQRDDILMVMSDLPDGRALARTFHVQDDRAYAINQRVCAIRPTRASPRYLFYLLNRNPWFLQNDDGMNQTHLSVSDFRKMPLVLPPVDEQEAIGQRLDSVVTICSGLIGHAETCIGVLQERRSALISAAVTGQIDVRGLVGSEAA